MAFGEVYYAQWRDYGKNDETVITGPTVGDNPPVLTASVGKFTLDFTTDGLNDGRAINFGVIKNAYDGQVINISFVMSGASASTIDFQVGSANQISGLTNQSDGEYTIQCTLNSSYDHAEFTIYSTSAANTLITFSSVRIEGLLHEVKLLQDGYGGGTTEIEDKGVTPVIINRRGDKDVQTDKSIIGSELQFNFFSLPGDVSGFDSMFESEFKDWKVEHYYNNSLDWVGWLQPDNYSRDWIQVGSVFAISLSATDGLASLKNIEFKNFTSGFQYTDRVSIITTIKRALEHIEHAIDFRVQLGTYCSNDSLMTSTDCALDKVKVDNSRFTKDKDGREVNEDCYSIIEKVLKPFNCYLVQSEGYWWILNPQEKDSYYFPITWSGLTIGSRTANDLAVDLANYKYRTNTDLQKIRPLEDVEVTFRDRNVADNLLSNGDFATASTSEWVNIDWGIFTTVSFEADNELRSFNRNVTHGVPTAPLVFHSIAEAIVLRGEDDKFNATFKVRCSDLIMDAGWSGNDYLEKVSIKCRLRKTSASGSIIYPSSGVSQFSISADESSYTTYNFLFDIPASDDYFLELTIDKVAPNWSDYDIIDLRWDDFYFKMDYSDGTDLTFDRFYEILNADSVFTDKHKQDTFFGDSSQDNDIGSFQIGVSRTTTWNRYGKTEDEKIAILYAQNVIENFAKYKDYVRATIIDPSHTLSAYSLVTIDAKDYQIVESTEIFAGGSRKEIECQLIEVLNAAVTTQVSTQALTSVDGESTSSSSQAVSGGGGGGASINDSTTETTSTWSSTKIDSEISSITESQWVTSGSTIYYNVGNVGINDATPTYKLDVNGTFRTVGRAYMDGDASIGNTATTYALEVNGTVNATDFRSTSDRRKKKKITPIKRATEILKKLQGVSFFWRKGKDKRKKLGLIAQDVEMVAPESVDIDNEGNYTLSYNTFIPLLIEAVKELEDRIKALEQ